MKSTIPSVSDHGKEKHKEDEEEEELEFDDPSFLLPPPPNHATTSSTSTSTYAQRRQQSALASTAKVTQNNLLMKSTATGKKRELQQREQGLATNLITTQLEQGNESKAFKLMKMMGFTPGQGLGKRIESPPLDQSTSTSTSTFKPITEPISFEIRQGRTGLGIPSLTAQARPRTIPRPTAGPSSSVNIDKDNLNRAKDYTTSHREAFLSRQVMTSYKSVCKTCEQLDRQAGMETSLMWAFESSIVADEDIRKERTRLAMMRDEVSNTVVDLDEEVDDKLSSEEEAWFALDIHVRLKAIVKHLRTSYCYCFWCGCSYNDLVEMTVSCPGEEEEDH